MHFACTNAGIARFLQRVSIAMQSAVLAIVNPALHLYVCLSVTRYDAINQSINQSEFFNVAKIAIAITKSTAT